MFVYNIANRKYRLVPNAVGGVAAWLKDGRLVVVNPKNAIIVHPATGATQPLVVPDPRGLANLEVRLSRDQQSAYMSMAVAETDIWMVTLGR